MIFRVEKPPSPIGEFYVTDASAKTSGRYLQCRVFSFESYRRDDGTWMDRMLDHDEKTESAAVKIAAALNAE